MSTTVAQALVERFPGDIEPLPAFRDEEAFVVRKERLLEVCRFLFDFPGSAFELLEDICGVDYPGRQKRFEAVYHLYSLQARRRIRLKVPLEESDPTVPSVIGIWKAADWFEREAFDQYGIRFEGHPNLRRILNHEEFVGHPLRKDYPIQKRQPLSKPTNFGWDQGGPAGRGEPARS